MQSISALFRAIKNLPKTLVKPPVLSYRDGRPHSSFNQFQFWAYPEECIKQAKEALAHCPPEMQIRQRSILSAYFGASFS